MKLNWVTKLALLFVLLGAAWAQGPSYPYSVTITFTASTGTVTGYNMYRAPYTTTCGTYAKLNTAPFTGTTYTDSNPAQGAYCYAATAVDGTAESGLSQPVTNIQIPPPPPSGLGVTLAQNKSADNATFAWKQSKGTKLSGNSLFCDGSLKKTIAPTTKLQLTVTKGLHTCDVTASAAQGMSGPSNSVTFTENK